MLPAICHSQFNENFSHKNPDHVENYSFKENDLHLGCTRCCVTSGQGQQTLWPHSLIQVGSEEIHQGRQVATDDPYEVNSKPRNQEVGRLQTVWWREREIEREGAYLIFDG